MIYITGDCHGSFSRFTKKKRLQLPFQLSSEDYVIICGDVGLLWCYDKECEYNLKFLGELPFTILWVQGNHENYHMIKDFPLEEWNGGLARHIVRDKIILLERGSVFNIEGKTFFTFGGASSHDISGGILDRQDPEFHEKRKKARMEKLPVRIKDEEWWEEELPTKEEMELGLSNLERCNYQVDYCITHCSANRLQPQLEKYYFDEYNKIKHFPPDCLTNYFELLEDKLSYKHWYFGHYHVEWDVDEKHTVVYQHIIPVI